MAIKNKDGTIYTLKGPNPLMKEQENFKEFALHNFKWTPEVHTSPTKVVPAESDFNIKKLDVQEQKSEPKKEEPQPKKIEVVEKIEKSEDVPGDPRITRIHCLPVKTEKKIDELYGEARTVRKYDDPFLFEAVIVDQNDFSIVFWTNINILEEGSIIYPANKDKRWWKVNKMESKNEGYLYDGYPSDIHPDFS